MYVHAQCHACCCSQKNIYIDCQFNHAHGDRLLILMRALECRTLATQSSPLAYRLPGFGWGEGVTHSSEYHACMLLQCIIHIRVLVYMYHTHMSQQPVMVRVYHAHVTTLTQGVTHNYVNPQTWSRLKCCSQLVTLTASVD